MMTAVYVPMPSRPGQASEEGFQQKFRCLALQEDAAMTPALGIIIYWFLMFSSWPSRYSMSERGVIFRLGRIIDHKGPGIIILIPVIDRMVR
jgi:hypothetical protein